MFIELQKGISRYTTLSEYGQQDIGISTCGAMDRFSYMVGNIILGNDFTTESLEFIYPPVLEVVEDGFIIYTGGECSGGYIDRNGSKIKTIFNRVYKVAVGDKIYSGNRVMGFRSYLSYIKSSCCKNRLIEGKSRGDYKDICSWHKNDGYIRVIEGPEYSFLNNKNSLEENYWVVSKDTSNMGMRLQGSEIKVEMGNMVSEAVADGTIQITPNGPIILLRHRQTVGGYPRCFNVIETDLDLLAQYMPGQVVKFKLVSLDEAFKASLNMKNDLDRLRKKFN